MIDLVNADQPRGKFEHVVTQRNNNELRVLGAFFDVGGYDGDLGEGVEVSHYPSPQLQEQINLDD